MKTIQILGTGCPKCRTLAAHVEQAVRETGVSARIEKVEKIAEIAKFGVAVTPALVIDGQVRTSGRVPSVEEIKKLLV